MIETSWLLPARHLVRIKLEIYLDIEIGDDLFDACVTFGLRHTHHLERIGDIVESAQPWKHRFAIVLKDVTELDLVQRLAVEQDLAGIGRKQSRDHVDQSALAAAVGAEHRHQPAARNIEIEIIVDRGVGKTLGQPAYCDMRSGPLRRIVDLSRRFDLRS